MKGNGTNIKGITPHHSFLWYTQVSSFAETVMTSSGLPQTSTIFSLDDDVGVAPVTSADGASFVHSFGSATISPRQPESVMEHKITHDSMIIRSMLMPPYSQCQGSNE
jgi:hypothetical protein